MVRSLSQVIICIESVSQGHVDYQVCSAYRHTRTHYTDAHTHTHTQTVHNISRPSANFRPKWHNGQPKQAISADYLFFLLYIYVILCTVQTHTHVHIHLHARTQTLAHSHTLHTHRHPHTHTHTSAHKHRHT